MVDADAQPGLNGKRCVPTIVGEMRIEEQSAHGGCDGNAPRCRRVAFGLSPRNAGACGEKKRRAYAGTRVFHGVMLMAKPVCRTSFWVDTKGVTMSVSVSLTRATSSPSPI